MHNSIKIEGGLKYAEKFARGAGRQLTYLLLHLGLGSGAVPDTVPPSYLPALAACHTAATPVTPSIPLSVGFTLFSVITTVGTSAVESLLFSPAWGL